MAACTTTYFEAGRGWGTRAAERNAELMAQQALRRRACARRSSTSPGTSTIRGWSRPGPGAGARDAPVFRGGRRAFSLVMIYGLQHFNAIEGGYRVESEKQAVDQLREENRQLRLAEAQLSQPGRIDSMAANWVLRSRSLAR